MPTDIIQWFPGHMAKTRRLISEKLSLVDAVFDLRDARIPFSSANPEIEKLTAGKPRLIILNKASLCDRDKLSLWIEKYRNTGVRCIAADCMTGEGFSKLKDELAFLCSDKLQRYAEKGMSRKLKVMVLGIPNVGKSSLINRLAGGNKAKVENRPGVTREPQWFPTPYGFDMMDMPGVLWPKFDSRTVAENLAISGAIKNDVFDMETVALALIGRLRRMYPELLAARYKLGADDDFGGIEDIGIYEAAARSRGMLLKGGEVDYERFAGTIIDEFRNAKIGKITLDTI
ncbi:MAG: ribosome biogenesis GTPase YlqF [Clostridia bacterium]|nr:ribosome biogenesis GTPase YlqF [Clostridia bacterium]